MSAITDIKCILSQKAFDAFCEKIYIPEEVHHVLPNQGDTMHERPARKIGLYTSFFDFANFRLPLSTFLVNILRHFRINISQLSVIGATKVSHFEILCRVYGITPTVGLFRCFYVNSKNNGWMSFSKRLINLPDPAPATADFNAHDYATLVAHPCRFWKFPEEFQCLVGLIRHYTFNEETYPWLLDKDGEDMDIFAFIHTLDPTKVKVVERERTEDEPRLLDTTVGCIVPLLSVAPDRTESELKASVDKLFDDGGSGNQAGQGDFAGVGERANIQPVTEATDTVAEDLLAGAVLNAEVRGEPIPTLPFVTSSVSAMSGREDSSHHSGTNVVEAEVDFLIRSSAPVMTTVTIVTPTVDTAAGAKEKPVEPSLFGAASSSAGGTDPTPGGFSDLTGSDFIVGGIRTVISPDTNLQKVADVRMRAEYNIKEKRRLKSVAEERAELFKVREKEVEDLKAQLLLKEAEAAEDDVKALKECNASLERERDALDVKVTRLEALAMGKERELTDLNAQLAFVKSHNDSLVDQVHELEVSSSGLQEKLSSYENLTKWLKEFQDAQLKIVNDKFDKLYADFVEMALHLEEKFYQHILTTISGRRWLLTHGMKLVIIKCLDSPEYLSALGAEIGKAIEKGMQDGLAAGITHGKERMELTDVAAHNPSAEVDYVSALQQLQDPLVERLGLSELQPHVDQLMVLIHRSLDQVVLGASALLLALDVSSSRVQKIKENIANHRSALHDVFVPLAEPLSVMALTDMEGASNVIPATANTTTALSITSTSASTIAHISVYDYEVVGTDNQADADGNAEPFPNIDDAELNIPQ
ncbi:hypothetical protein Tco_0995772 [Tanacetum coccineum]